MSSVQPALQMAQPSLSTPTVQTTNNQSTAQSTLDPLGQKPLVAGATPISTTTSTPKSPAPQQQPPPSPVLNAASPSPSTNTSRPTALPVQNTVSQPTTAVHPQKTSAQANIHSQSNVTLGTSEPQPAPSEREHWWQLWREPVKDDWTRKDRR